MNIRFATLLTAALLAVAAPAPAQLPRVFFHGISLYDRTGVEFTVNGFPFRSVAAAIQPLITTDLTPYLVRGANDLRWRFTGQPKVEVSGVFRFRLEKKTENGSEVAVAESFTLERFMEFQEEGDAPDTVTFFNERYLVKPAGGFRHELRSRLAPGAASRAVFDLVAPESGLAPLPVQPSEAALTVAVADAPLLTLPWQGPPVVLTPADEAEIRGIITSMRAAFVAQDTTALADMQTIRIQRFAAARAETEAEFRQELLASYAALFGDPPFVFAPIDPAQLTLTSYPGVNLVQVQTGGQPPISATGRSDGQEVVFKVPVFVSKITGSWKIVD